MTQLLFKVEGVKLSDLFDWSLPSKMCQVHKKEVKLQPVKTLFHVNEVPLALFRYGMNAYAVDANCPHAGGPLHLGDIEDSPNGKLCVRCPWHNWRFYLETGKPVFSKDNVSSIKTYPVIIANDGNLSIGFDSINKKYFTSEDF